MSTTTLRSDLSYPFPPAYSSSAWRAIASEWEAPSASALAATETADEDIGRPLVVSVAQSIIDFERLIQRVMVDFWGGIVETQAIPTELDVEQEVIAHLPPKRVFETTLRVRYVGRARPNITLELIDDDL